MGIRGYCIPQQRTWLLLGFLCTLGVETNGKEDVRITRFEVPSHAQVHDDVTMICEHNLSNERFNSISWKHNDQWFYSYNNDQDIPKNYFNDSGLTVDMEQSSATKLVLLNISLAAAGTYNCLARGEAADFATDSKEANMTVAVIPNEKPLIEPPPDDGLRIGSNVEFNCSVAPSYPAATLDWQLNGHKVPESNLIRYNATKTKDGLYVHKLGLRFKVESKHFVNSELKLKCTAGILSLYNEKDEHTHQMGNVGERPAEPSVNGKLSNSNGGGRLACLAPVGLWLAAGIAAAFAISR